MCSIGLAGESHYRFYQRTPYPDLNHYRPAEGMPDKADICSTLLVEEVYPHQHVKSTLGDVSGNTVVEPERRYPFSNKLLAQVFKDTKRRPIKTTEGTELLEFGPEAFKALLTLHEDIPERLAELAAVRADENREALEALARERGDGDEVQLERKGILKRLLRIVGR